MKKVFFKGKDTGYEFDVEIEDDKDEYAIFGDSWEVIEVIENYDKEMGQIEEKALEIQKAFRMIEKSSIDIARYVGKDRGHGGFKWGYLQERRERHVEELRNGVNQAYGAINLMINVDGLDRIDVKDGDKDE